MNKLNTGCFCSVLISTHACLMQTPGADWSLSACISNKHIRESRTAFHSAGTVPTLCRHSVPLHQIFKLHLTALLTAASKPGWKYRAQHTPLLNRPGWCSACHLTTTLVRNHGNALLHAQGQQPCPLKAKLMSQSIQNP